MKHSCRRITHSGSRNVYENRAESDRDKKQRFKVFRGSEPYDEKSHSEHDNALPAGNGASRERVDSHFLLLGKFFSLCGCTLFCRFRVNHLVDAGIFPDVRKELGDIDALDSFGTFDFRRIDCGERSDFFSRILCECGRFYNGKHHRDAQKCEHRYENILYAVVSCIHNSPPYLISASGWPDVICVPGCARKCTLPAVPALISSSIFIDSIMMIVVSAFTLSPSEAT